MYKFIATGLVALESLLLLALPLQAQEVKQNRDCTATVAAAQKRIETGRVIELRISSTDISEDYPDHPEGRPYRYFFIVDGAAAESVMNSPKFQTSIATEVINNCSSVGSVTFGLDHSGWSSSTGLMPNGKIEAFECLDHEPNNPKLKWGQEYCSL